MLQIPPDHKYGTVAIHVSHHLTLQFSEPLGLGGDLWVTGEMPVALPEHWQTWLGSLKVDELRRANLFLFAHRLSARPGDLDEDRQLQEAVRRLYFALLIAVPYIGHENGSLMSGGHHDGNLDLRHVQQYDDVLAAPGCRGAVLNDAMLREAKQIADGFERVEGTGAHLRVWRIVRAFYAALQDHELGDRIHQFVRCVEGFVLPSIGNTRNQMTSRTELFLGPTQHTLMQTLFDVRSAVEHLHGPGTVVAHPGPGQVDLRLAELSFQSEALARYCLRRLLTVPALWPLFQDDATLAAFWQLPAAQRSAVWGAPMNTAAEFGHFNRTTAATQLP